MKLRAPEFKTQYRALGLVNGHYIPTNDSLDQGIVVCPDRCFPAALTSSYKTLLESNPHLLQDVDTLRAYIKTTPETPYLYFEIKSAFKRSARISRNTKDKYNIRGQLVKYDPHTQYVKILILGKHNRNPKSKQPQKPYKPFSLILRGILPPNISINDFIDIQATRNDTRLVITKATLVATNAELTTTKSKSQSNPSTTKPQSPKSTPKPKIQNKKTGIPPSKTKKLIDVSRKTFI